MTRERPCGTPSAQSFARFLEPFFYLSRTGGGNGTVWCQPAIQALTVMVFVILDGTRRLLGLSGVLAIASLSGEKVVIVLVRALLLLRVFSVRMAFGRCAILVNFVVLSLRVTGRW